MPKQHKKYSYDTVARFQKLSHYSTLKKIRYITKISYFSYNVNPSKSVRMNGVFLGLAGLLLKKPRPSLLFYLD